VLAGLVGRSESWLSRVERGKRGIDSHSVLARLAEVLRVDIEELTGSGDGDERGRRVHPAASLIEQAMMAYGAPGAQAKREEPDHQVGLDHLRTKARSAYRAYQATRYDTTGRILPGLIRGVETAARSVGAASPAACGVRVLVYDTTAALLSRVGEPFLAWAAADRARSAAEYAGDPLLAAVSAWRLSYMITGRKYPQEGLGLAMTAAAALERAMRAPSPEQLSVYGALHLAAATAAAACYDRARTETMLATARGVADRTGETNHMGTAFGPVNVAIHAISASLRLGDPRTATQTGEALDTAAMPAGLVGRRTQVNLDLARAYAMCRKDAAAVNLLLAAERLSPQLVRYNRATREVLTELLRREHRPSTPELPAGTSHGCDLTRTSVRVPHPHPHPGPLPSRRCGAFPTDPS
jgi:transcriptional regulator with XRE-family HTH domain